MDAASKASSVLNSKVRAGASGTMSLAAGGAHGKTIQEQRNGRRGRFTSEHFVLGESPG
jgi:hypothetical protein